MSDQQLLPYDDKISNTHARSEPRPTHGRTTARYIARRRQEQPLAESANGTENQESVVERFDNPFASIAAVANHTRLR